MVLGPTIDYWVTAYTVGPSVMLGAVLLILLFPDGRLPHPMWRTVLWMAIGGAGLVSLWWLTWSESTVGRFVMTLGKTGGGCSSFTCLASVFSAFGRMQGAGARERQQLKWFAYGAAVFFGAFLFLMAVGDQLGGWVVFAVIVGGLSAVPMTVGVAMLKHRLYDVDVVINRTLVYGALTALLAAGYFGSIMALQGIGSLVFQVPFRAITGQETQLATVAATLAMVAFFNSLRRRIQSFIDRSFYRRKYDARKTLESFSAQLRDETDLDALSDDLVGVVRETMQPAHVSLWLRPEPNPKKSGGN
jgi:hypothetical protein